MTPPTPSPLMDRLFKAFEMTADLLDHLSEDDLGRSLQEPSNTIWDQLWCVVGARESHILRQNSSPILK